MVHQVHQVHRKVMKEGPERDFEDISGVLSHAGALSPTAAMEAGMKMEWPCFLVEMEAVMPTSTSHNLSRRNTQGSQMLG